MNPPDTFHVRRARLEDAGDFTTQRLAVFREMHGLGPGPEADHLARTTRESFAAWFGREDTFVWLAQAPGAVAGSAALHTFHRFPSPQNPCPREAYVSHVFVAPEWRRRGVASALMQAVLEQARGLGLRRIRLHATEPGRALYEVLGFRLRTNDMELTL